MKGPYFDLESRAIVDISESPWGNGYWINRVRTPDVYQGRGIARRLMQQVMDDADAEGVHLFLVINPYGPMNRKQLKTWYLRLGFVQQPHGVFRRLPRKATVENV